MWRIALLLLMVSPAMATPAISDVDTDYDALRSRTGEPTIYHLVHVADVLKLPTFPQQTPRSSWWPSDITKVGKWESQGVIINGYVLDQNYLQQETCNPKGTYTLMFHLGEIPGRFAGASGSMVCHITPAAAKAHKNWTPEGLKRITGYFVKISGWMLWDSYYTIDVGNSTATCWEISPVTRIQYDDNGEWKDL